MVHHIFRVKARNVVGDSEPSNESIAATPPSAPQNFNLTNSQIFIYGIFSGNILDATPTTVGILPINTYTANMRIELCGF